MTVGSKWATRLVAVGVMSLAAIVSAATMAGASASAPVPADFAQQGYVSSQVKVDYDCLVTFPGGSANMPYSLTFKVSAPNSVAPQGLFGIAFDPPVITPNPAFQSDVRDVELQFKLPASTTLLGYALYGGSGLGGSKTTVERRGNVLVLKATGPFQANTPFDLPSLLVGLKAGHKGLAQSVTGGTGVDNPSFRWMRNSVTPGDPPGTLRPLLCEPPAPVKLSSTTVG